MKIPQVSASEAEARTPQMVLTRRCTGPLGFMHCGLEVGAFESVYAAVQQFLHQGELDWQHQRQGIESYHWHGNK